MIFWICLLLPVVFTVLMICGEKAHNGNWIMNSGWGIATFGGLVTAWLCLIICLCAIANAHIKAEGECARNTQRYNAIVYKIHNAKIRDDFGIMDKSFVDEVGYWNERYSEYMAMSENIWVGVFYPSKCFDGTELIDLEYSTR